ncbi:MAG: glycosyltransferase [Planctomycetes bacterium]|nr:glycosyltransferase [Planctomycetota bacterium]
MSPLKGSTSICFIITRMVAGGAQKVLLDLIACLPEDEYQIHIISGIETGKEGSLWSNLTELLAPENIHACPAMIRSVNPIKDYIAYGHIRKILRKIKPDIVHTHTSKAGVVGRFAAIKEKVPKIIHSTHGLIYNSDANIPGVGGSLSLKAFKAVEEHLGKSTHSLITLSQEETGEAIRLNLAPASCIQNISNGVPLQELAAIERDPSSWKVPHIRLGIAGRLNKEKGHELLIRSMQKVLKSFPNISLKIAGRGPLKEELENLSAELGISDHIHFDGFHHNISEFLKNIDIFILSSHYEGFGLVLIEAMAAGLPIVATDVGGVREVVKDGITGLIVPSGREDELCMGIEYFLQHPKLAYEFGVRGRAHVMGSFSLTQMIDKHIEIYQQQPSLDQNLKIPEGHMLIDLHMHSRFSFDSKTKIELILKQAKSRGASAISVTDHESLEGSLMAMKLAPKDLMIIPGMEINTDVGDVIALFIQTPIQSKEFNEVVDEIRSQNGIVYLPHPFRGRRSISLDLVKKLDVFEIYNGRTQGINYADDQFGNQDIVNFAKGANLTGVGGSDAHKANEVAKVMTCVPHFSSPEELKEILLSGNIFPVMSHGEWIPETLSEDELNPTSER